MLRAIDANIFMDAKDRYYPFEGCPGFWEWLHHAFDEGKLISAEEVYKEILADKSGGPLKIWAKPLKRYFLIPDEEIVTAYHEIAQYVKGKYTREEKVDVFLRGADAWLIATAMAKQVIVVTNETLVPGDPPDSKVKIPNVCEKFGVKYETNIFPFMKKEKVRLVLDKKGK